MKLEIVAGTEVALSTEVADLYIPAFYGQAGILSRHLPFVSLLTAGELSYLDPRGRRHYLFIEGGVLKVENDAIRLLCDSFRKGEDFVAADLQKELVATQQKIKTAFQGAITPDELDRELKREKILRIQLAIAKKAKK